VVEKIIDTYLDLRDGARETFLQAYRRVGMEPFKEALYATAD
jgi:sulfite reductase (NADPH) hemoprotein beta-component